MQAARSSPGFWAEVVMKKKVKRRNIVSEILAKLGGES